MILSLTLYNYVSLLSGGLSRAVHFWIGLESSDDEAGCAAYKAVELSDAFLGLTQYREVQVIS